MVIIRKMEKYRKDLNGVHFLTGFLPTNFSARYRYKKAAAAHHSLRLQQIIKKSNKYVVVYSIVNDRLLHHSG